MLKVYYQLTKPGIIYGNMITATAGFLLASGRHINPGLLLATLFGTSLVIACGCVLNNYIDRGIDKKMARTKKRALVTKQIPAQNALVFAGLLGGLGFLVLAVYTNLLTVALGVVALFSYVVLYGVAKRRSVWGTTVGSISGALPPVAGYTAASNSLDGGALLLFLVLVCWQMPHFYAIAMYRFDDYAAAGLPVWPVKKGMQSTKVQILLYIAAFIVATALLTILGYTSYTYLIITAALGGIWFFKGTQGLSTKEDKPWARKMFLFSLIVILVFSATISFGALLP